MCGIGRFGDYGCQSGVGYRQHGCDVGVGGHNHLVAGSHRAHDDVRAQNEPKGIESVAHGNRVCGAGERAQTGFETVYLLSAYKSARQSHTALGFNNLVDERRVYRSEVKKWIFHHVSV